MTVRDFYFIAGDVALDLVNTEVVRNGQQADLLDGTDALGQWLAAAGLLSAERSRAAATSTALAAIRGMRKSLRDIARALSEGKPPKKAAVGVIEEELRRGRGALTLRYRGGVFSSFFEVDDAHVDDPRFLVARAAAAFLATAEPHRIHPCHGAGCVLFFYDVTKSGTRRWCSMAGCGNRAKAAEHYRRNKSS